jgi:glucose-6-phosphate isomerase
VFAGNRPSTSLLLQKVTPFTLGALLSLYEMKIFVQGVVWGINSFDQWGVELGKVLAKAVLRDMSELTSSSGHDSSTNGLIDFYKRHRPQGRL